MSESNPWSRLRETWEVVFMNPSSKDEFGDPPVAHLYTVTRSDSLRLLLRASVPQQQMTRELHGLLQAINEGLLDDLEHEIPLGYEISKEFGE